MGLKLDRRHGNRRRKRSGLNRTSVGLKPFKPLGEVGAHPLPQSNQRGIETRRRREQNQVSLEGLNRTSVGLKRWRASPCGSCGTCLNRTSVGLKLSDIIRTAVVLYLPQSNQRGIETQGKAENQQHPQSQPQSNQRGIETMTTVRRASRTSMSLNRTSVGLKPSTSRAARWRARWPQSNQRGIETIPLCASPPRPGRPQSNQRGIETLDKLDVYEAQPPRLNRTSVGLKLSSGSTCQTPRMRASIEPAWD